MASYFDRYYYDPLKEEELQSEWTKTKIQVASESVVGLLDHLKPEEHLAIVLFDDQPQLVHPLKKVQNTNMEALKKHILRLHPGGGTNMSSGIELAGDLFKEHREVDSKEVENRIIFLTDAQPNLGDTGEEELVDMIKRNAEKKIYTTFIGIGVDFNTELIELFSQVRGANYYSVHSPTEFKERMVKNFDNMVTPLVFDLSVTIEAPGFELQKVYGAPGANEATKEIIKISTLFPSEKEKETKGGLILLHMKKLPDHKNSPLHLKVSYEDRNGKIDNHSEQFNFMEPVEGEYYDNKGVRKGIVFARYVNLLKNWLLYERKEGEKSNSLLDTYRDHGIPHSVDSELELGQWERNPQKLIITSEYKELFRLFSSYFEKEMEIIGDSSMTKEKDLLNHLINHHNRID